MGGAVSLASSSRPFQSRSSQGVGAGDGEEASGWWTDSPPLVFCICGL